MRVYRSLKHNQKLHLPHEVFRNVNFRVPMTLYGRIKEQAIREQKSQTLLLNELLEAAFEARDAA